MLGADSSARPRSGRRRSRTGRRRMATRRCRCRITFSTRRHITLASCAAASAGERMRRRGSWFHGRSPMSRTESTCGALDSARCKPRGCTGAERAGIGRAVDSCLEAITP